MSDSADLAHGVLLRVAEFVRRLPADQLAALADGTVKLQVASTARRAAPTTRAKAAPVSAEQVRAELDTIGDPVAGRRWLADQGLTVAHLKELAKGLGVAVPSKAKKDAILDQIVQSTVGRRLDFAAISRPAPARF